MNLIARVSLALASVWCPLAAEASEPTSKWVVAEDGERLHVLRFAAARPTAVLVMAHGLQSHAEWFRGSGDYLSDRGIEVLAYDRRGSGRSGGARGDLTSAEVFFTDLDAVLTEAGRSGRPVHLLANCFSTRFVLPYVQRHPGQLRSLILTSPATDMRPEADYSALGRTGVLAGALAPVPLKLPTPLRDELFISSGPWLEWIGRDHLSLREVTPRFLLAAGSMDKQMRAALGKIQTPMLVLLATDDAMVDNERIKERFRRQPGPVRIETLHSEHMLEFGASAGTYRRLLLEWVKGGHRAAGFAAERPAELARPLPERGLWLANGSRVDFADLGEIDSQVYGRGREGTRFEGFFAAAVEGRLMLPQPTRRDACLSPETEWVIMLRDPEATARALSAPTEAGQLARLQSLPVELRGMIEGKWLDALRAETATVPNWIAASGGNNVIADRGQAMSLGEVFAHSQTSGTAIRVFRVSAGGMPQAGDKPLFCSPASDIAASAQAVALAGLPEDFPVAAVRAALEQWVKSGGDPRQLRGVNLSALGKRDALVNEEKRHQAAKAPREWPRLLAQLGRHRTAAPGQLLPRVGMNVVTNRAIREGDNGLEAGSEYLLEHIDYRGRVIGRARLGFAPTP
ncbi:MAG: alpha/beta fold hydrolase [Verrucomicrobiales bacterium]|nr:alpha/beta fold hydrolase [Verrucomicrobiales bacterium]